MDALSRSIGILLKVEKSYIPKAEYVFRTYCKIIGLQPNFFYDDTREDVHVYYGSKSDEKYPIEIYYDENAAKFFEDSVPLDNKLAHFVRYRNDNVPFIFSKHGRIFQYSLNCLEICKDIVASAFFFLTCWQEYATGKLKSCEPLDFSCKFQKEWNIDDFPIVDRYCDIFHKALETALPGYQKENRWPFEKTFAVSVSHFRHNALSMTSSSNNHRDYNKKLKQLEKHYELSPTNFLPLPLEESTPIPNTNSNGKFNQAIGLITTQSFDLNILRNTIKQYSDNLTPVHGFCYMEHNFHYHDLMEQLDGVGIKYDMSISYFSLPGYRAGISYPFYPFNIKENLPFSVLEIPLVLNSRISTATMNLGVPKELTKKYTRNLMNYLVRYSLQNRSHFSFCWNEATGKELDESAFHYGKTIEELGKKNAWLCSLDEIYEYWSNR